MKKNNKHLKIDQSLTLYIMLVLLILIIVASLILTIVSAINKNLFFEEGSLGTFMIIGLIVMLIISIVISYFVNKIINKYIANIQSALRNVKNGNFDTKFKESKNKYINEIITDFNLMVDELKSVPMLRNDFVSNFSHEFKTPIASIKGFAEVIKSKTNLTKEEKDEYLQIIIDECSRLSDLANNTLLISKLDTQNKLQKLTKIYLDEQIDQCLFLLDKNIKEKNIIITTNLVKTPYYCDPNLMQQVWLNILDNAIKFTKDKINIDITNKDDNIVIQLEDNGIGIPTKDLPHIFEKFYQADHSHTQSGSGLGLATASKIIKLHNGTIEVESKENMYTKFVITLPTTQNK